MIVSTVRRYAPLASVENGDGGDWSRVDTHVIKMAAYYMVGRHLDSGINSAQ